MTSTRYFQHVPVSRQQARVILSNRQRMADWREFRMAVAARQRILCAVFSAVRIYNPLIATLPRSAEA